MFSTNLEHSVFCYKLRQSNNYNNFISKNTRFTFSSTYVKSKYQIKFQGFFKILCGIPRILLLLFSFIDYPFLRKTPSFPSTSMSNKFFNCSILRAHREIIW